MVSVLRRYRRKSLLDSPPTPEEVRTLASGLGVFGRLTDAQRERLVSIARILVREKSWEGCAGLELTDEICLNIAAQAALLLIGQEIDPMTDPVYPNVQTVLVYPSGFVAPMPRVGPGGVVTEGHSNLGEAHYMGQYGGPIIVSWRHAREGGLDGGDGRNLVLHEFAHKLDYMDGVSDGTPPLRDKDQLNRWRAVMTAHYTDLVRRAQRGEPSLLNYYGATNAAEFFAVSTETFFERGAELRHWMPELYGVLREYYGLETAAWQSGEPRTE